MKGSAEYEEWVLKHKEATVWLDRNGYECYFGGRFICPDGKLRPVSHLKHLVEYGNISREECEEFMIWDEYGLMYKFYEYEKEKGLLDETI